MMCGNTMRGSSPGMFIAFISGLFLIILAAVAIYLVYKGAVKVYQFLEELYIDYQCRKFIKRKPRQVTGAPMETQE